MFMKKHFLWLLAIGLVHFTGAQNYFPASGAVGIGTPSPHASALLDIRSTSKGVLIPRLTAAQRNAIPAPAQGLIVFQTNGAKGFYYYDGGWRSILNDAANRSLSNLGVTALNRDLLPNESNARNLGSSTLGFKDLYLMGDIYSNGVRITTRTSHISNFFVGPYAGNSLVSGLGNTGFGNRALQNLNSGFANTAIGDLALWSNITGSNNTAIGNSALAQNRTGMENSAIGMQSLVQNTTGFINTAVGAFSLYSNQTGNGNTGIGSQVLHENIAGNYNTAVGRNALLYMKEGNENVAIGSETADAATKLSSGTFLGARIYTADNVVNATAIGYGTAVAASNQVRVGNVWVNSIGGFRDWTNMSDGRFKNESHIPVPGLSFISLLRPVTYTIDFEDIQGTISSKSVESGIGNSTDYQSQILFSGFIAQEVELAAEVLKYNFSGLDKPTTPNDLYGLRYGTFVVPLVKAVQELHATVTTLQEELELLKKEIELLRTQSGNQVLNNRTTGMFLQQIVPNPAQNTAVVYYELPAGSSHAQLLLANMQGQQVRQYALSGKSRQFVLNTSALPAGTYTCSLLVGGNLLDSKNISVVR